MPSLQIYIDCSIQSEVLEKKVFVYVIRLTVFWIYKREIIVDTSVSLKLKEEGIIFSQRSTTAESEILPVWEALKLLLVEITHMENYVIVIHPNQSNKWLDWASIVFFPKNLSLYTCKNTYFEIFKKAQISLFSHFYSIFLNNT